MSPVLEDACKYRVTCPGSHDLWVTSWGLTLGGMAWDPGVPRARWGCGRKPGLASRFCHIYAVCPWGLLYLFEPQFPSLPVRWRS